MAHAARTPLKIRFPGAAVFGGLVPAVRVR